MDTPAAPPPLTLDRSQPCVKCAYDLRGLPLDGVCPECGTPVQDSLRGWLLRYASPEYRRKLGLGLSIVLNGILAMVVLTILQMVAGFSGWRGGGFDTGMHIVNFGLAIAMIAGYWFMTEPDPGYTGLEKPNSARQVLRTAVLAQAGLNLLSVVLVLTGAMSTSPTGVTAATAFVLLLGFAGLVAWAVQFFATMRYMRWLAGRVPDAAMQKRTETYMWLLPVLSIVGIILVGLGPLIALILYWNLLDQLRKHLRTINRQA